MTTLADNSCGLRVSDGQIATQTSRFANPFATCWTRPGAIGWIPTATANVEQIVERFETTRSGQIIGPHGVGKSSLLEAFSTKLQARGDSVVRWTLNGRNEKSFAPPSLQPEDVLLVDGFEQLSVWSRWQIVCRARQQASGLLVTTHRRALWPFRLPVLVELQPSLLMVLAVFAQLVADRSTPVTAADVAQSFEHRSGNVRDIWFDLYDLHERLSCRARTNCDCQP